MGIRRASLVLIVLLAFALAVVNSAVFDERRLQAGSAIDDSGSVEFPSDSGSSGETTPAPSTSTPKPSTTTAPPSTTTAAPSTTAPSSTTATPTATTVQPAVGSSSSSTTSSLKGSNDASATSSGSGTSSQATNSGSSSTNGVSSSSGSTSSSSSSGLTSGILIGIITGGIVLVVVVFGFLAIRCCRRKREALETGISIESPVPRGQSRDYKITSPAEWGGVYHEVTATTGTKSTMRSFSNRGSLWEDPDLTAARIPLDSIRIGELLGQGGYGEVYRGEYRNQPVAIKRLLPATRKSMQHIENFLAEIKLMVSMEHPHIVQFVGVAWDSLSDLLCLTEFMAGGDLRTLLMRCKESLHPVGFDPTKANIALHIAHGLTYLHSLNPIVLHRDLKSRNILLTSKLEAKLTDFGVSRERSDRTMTAGVGSCLWMAPEVMVGKRYDEKADVFSLGIVMAELDTHELPYSHVREPDTGHPLPDMVVLQLVTAGRLSVQLTNRLQPNLRHLIAECVNLDPLRRPTAAQVLYELQVIAKSMH